MTFVRVLRVPHIAVLWIGQVLSAVGDQLFLLAVLWIAVRQAGSAAGLLTALGLAVALLFGLTGGVLADRLNHRAALIGVDLTRAVAVALLPLLAATVGLRLWHIVLIIVVVEALGTLFDPALQASLPLLSGDADTLYATNGLMESTHRLARILGPGMASILLLIVPLTHFFTLDALTFGISAGALALIGRRLDPAGQRDALSVAGLGVDHADLLLLAPIGARTRVWPAARMTSRLWRFVRDLGVAWHLACRNPPFFWSITTLGIINLAWSCAFSIGAPLWTNRVLHGDAGAYGLIVGAYGVGNVVSLFLGTLLPHRPMRMMFVGKVLQGLGFLVFACSSSLPVAAACAGVAAIGGALGDLTLITMVQTAFPPEHIGKLYSLRATIGSGGLMLGLVIAAPLFALVNVPLGIGLFGFVILATGGAGLGRFFHQ